MEIRRRRLLAAAAGVGTAALLGTPARARASGPDATRIMPLGDAVTAGIGSFDGSGWRGRLRRRLSTAAPVDFVGSRADWPFADTDHEGHPGMRCAQAVAAAPGWLARGRPDIVLLYLGTGDVLDGDPAAADHLGTLLATVDASAPDAHILICPLVGSPVPPLRQRMTAFNAALPRVVADAARHARLLGVPRLDPHRHFADALHPNDAGYRTLAAHWFAAVHPLLSGGAAPALPPHVPTA